MEEVFSATLAPGAPARKKRAEVNFRDLTEPEKELFRTAKAKEWSSWVAHRVVRLIDASLIDPRRVIRSRWVLNWKQGDKGNKTAKARLVLLGYQDPDLGTYRSDAPTIARQAKYLLANTAAIKGWPLFSLDAHTAFLLGDRQRRGKQLYFRPPPDLNDELGLPPWLCM